MLLALFTIALDTDILVVVRVLHVLLAITEPLALVSAWRELAREHLRLSRMLIVDMPISLFFSWPATCVVLARCYRARPRPRVSLFMLPNGNKNLAQIKKVGVDRLYLRKVTLPVKDFVAALTSVLHRFARRFPRTKFSPSGHRPLD